MKTLTKVALTLFAFVSFAHAAPNPPMRLLTWTATPGVTSYAVYSAPTPDGPFAKIGTTDVEAFVIPSNGGMVFYQVRPLFTHHKALILTPSNKPLDSSGVAELPLKR